MIVTSPKKQPVVSKIQILNKDYQFIVNKGKEDVGPYELGIPEGNMSFVIVVSIYCHCQIQVPNKDYHFFVNKGKEDVGPYESGILEGSTSVILFTSSKCQSVFIAIHIQK